MNFSTILSKRHKVVHVKEQVYEYKAQLTLFFKLDRIGNTSRIYKNRLKKNEDEQNWRWEKVKINNGRLLILALDIYV